MAAAATASTIAMPKFSCIAVLTTTAPRRS
jgi:hypothetical protein